MTSLLTNLLSSNWKINGKKLLLWAIIPLTAWYVSLNWYQLMLIQGSSMEPTYHHLEFVLLNRHDRQYTYGDVVAFPCDALACVLLKRVAACPGDVVRIEQGTLYVNGVVSQVYNRPGQFREAGLLADEVVLDEDSYLVLGDNLEKSRDSRYPEVGPVLRSDMLGKVVRARMFQNR